MASKGNAKRMKDAEFERSVLGATTMTLAEIERAISKTDAHECDDRDMAEAWHSALSALRHRIGTWSGGRPLL